MTDSQSEAPEIIPPEASDADEQDKNQMPVSEPGKVMRIGTMIKQLLEEVRTTDLDEPGRDRLRDIYELSIKELHEALAPELQSELKRLALPFSSDDVPSEPELQIAQAQLVGWLEGLFHGIQATLFAQQAAARQQIELMQKSQVLPSGAQPTSSEGSPQNGVYL